MPALPVVASFRIGIDDGELDCSVSHVHDHNTGKFREKIIVIHDTKDTFIKISVMITLIFLSKRRVCVECDKEKRFDR